MEETLGGWQGDLWGGAGGAMAILILEWSAALNHSG